jgi:hypothetical protein
MCRQKKSDKKSDKKNVRYSHATSGDTHSNNNEPLLPQEKPQENEDHVGERRSPVCQSGPMGEQ